MRYVFIRLQNFDYYRIHANKRPCVCDDEFVKAAVVYDLC